jgi:hypothetical protein
MKAGVLCPICGKFARWYSTGFSDWVARIRLPFTVELTGGAVRIDVSREKTEIGKIVIEHGCGFRVGGHWIDDFEIEFEFDPQNPDKVRFKGKYFRWIVPWEECYIYKAKDIFFVSKKRIERLRELEKNLGKEVFKFERLEGLSGVPYTILGR